MNPQDSQTVLQAVQSLASGLGNSVAPTPIPTLNYTAPTVADLSAQYNTFLNRAAKDPDIVNYYNQLLQTAEGDTSTAIGYLESDYQTGVRNTVSNLQGSLQSLAQTNKQNQASQQDSLNKRGIALTQNADGTLGYAGGGQAQTEVGNTQTQYALQQEAQQRSASQTVTTAAQGLKENVSKAQQGLTQNVQTMQGNMNTDIANRANTYMGLYNSNQQSKLQAAQQAQYDQMNGVNSAYNATTPGSYGSFANPDLSNPYKVSQYNQAKASFGIT